MVRVSFFLQGLLKFDSIQAWWSVGLMVALTVTSWGHCTIVQSTMSKHVVLVSLLTFSSLPYCLYAGCTTESFHGYTVKWIKDISHLYWRYYKGHGKTRCSSKVLGFALLFDIAIREYFAVYLQMFCFHGLFPSAVYICVWYIYL